jgi:hypothetical protein
MKYKIPTSTVARKATQKASPTNTKGQGAASIGKVLAKSVSDIPMRRVPLDREIKGNFSTSNSEKGAHCNFPEFKNNFGDSAKNPRLVNTSSGRNEKMPNK